MSKLLSAQLVITLKDPKVINSIRMKRKESYSNGIDGQDHTVYVSNIETRNIVRTTTAEGGISDTLTGWSTIPAFNQLERYRSSNSSVKVTATSSTARSAIRGGTVLTTAGNNRGRVSGRTVDSASSFSTGTDIGRPSERNRGALEQEITRSPIPTLSATTHTHSSDVLRPSDSQFSRASSWNFSSRLVKSIRISLYTEIPYKIRYSMSEYDIVMDVKNKKSTVMAKAFLQVADTRTKEEIDNSSSIELLRGRNIGFPDKILKMLSSSGMKVSKKLNEVRTIIRKDDSDLYRWSIGISDISATTNIYNTQGELISVRYSTEVPIDKIMLYTNHVLNGGSIEYYIIPDNGVAYRIQPWEEKDMKLEDGRYSPKILNINSEMPGDRRDNSKWGRNAYIDTQSPLYGFRLRAVLTRGPDTNASPFIRDYKVRIVPKEIGGVVTHAL